MMLTRDGIAWRIARDLDEGDYVNLGVGMPIDVLVVRPDVCDPELNYRIEAGEGADHLVGVGEQRLQFHRIWLVLGRFLASLLEEGAQLAHLLGVVVVDRLQRVGEGVREIGRRGGGFGIIGHTARYSVAAAT